MSVAQPVRWSEWEHGGPYPGDDGKKATDSEPQKRRVRPLSERRHITRELRIVEGGETVTLSVVETESPRTGWQTRSKLLTIYAVPWDTFKRDPDAAMRPALQGLIGPLLEDRAGEGNGSE